MVIIAGYIIVADEERDRYVEAHRDLITRARAFRGCIDLSIAADPVDPGRVNNTEIWQSAEDLEAWRAEADAPDHGIPMLDMAVQRYNATDGGPLF